MASPFMADELVGRTILSAHRDGFWLELVVSGEPPVRHFYAGGRVRVDLECPKCKEFRLVEVVEDKRGPQGVCAVCSHSWWIKP
jgi:hypothetical protein